MVGTITQEDDDKTLFAWNSEAVACLQDGNYSQAIAKFQTAMAGLRTPAADARGFRLHQGTGYGTQAGTAIPEDVSIVSVPVVKDNHATTTNNSNDTTGPSFALFGEASSDLTTKANDMDTTLFRLFDHAFVTIFLNYQGARGVHLTCSFVLYNLGLCVHHRELSKAAKCGTPLNPVVLRKALHLYTRSLHIIMASLGDGRPEDVILLLLALHNNMGNLYSHLAMLQECRTCLEWIRSLLFSYHQQVQHPHKMTSDIAFFYLNVLSLPENVFQKAAAA